MTPCLTPAQTLASIAVMAAVTFAKSSMLTPDVSACERNRKKPMMLTARMLTSPVRNALITAAADHFRKSQLHSISGMEVRTAALEMFSKM